MEQSDKPRIVKLSSREKHDIIGGMKPSPAMARAYYAVNPAPVLSLSLLSSLKTFTF